MVFSNFLSTYIGYLEVLAPVLFSDLLPVHFTLYPCCFEKMSSPSNSGPSSSSGASGNGQRNQHPFHKIPRSAPGVAPSALEVSSLIGATTMLRPLSMQAPLTENLLEGGDHKIKTKIHTLRHPFGGDDVACFVELAKRGLSPQYLLSFESFFFYKTPSDGFHIVLYRILPNQRVQMHDYTFKLENESPAKKVKSAKAPVKDVMAMGEAYKRAFGPIKYVE